MSQEVSTWGGAAVEQRPHRQQPAAVDQFQGMDSWVQVLTHVGELAATLADTDFVPKEMRRKPEAVTGAILYGREVGLPPMTSLTGIYVIHGKPAMYAETLRGLVLAAGHEIHIEEANSARCVMHGCRKGSDRWTTATFDADDAKRAGLANQEMYRKRPQEMYLARATTRLCRMIFADVIAGLKSVEELDDLDDDLVTAAPVSKPKARRSTSRSRKASTAVTASTSKANTSEPAEPSSPPPALPSGPPAAADTSEDGEAATSKQVGAIAALTEQLNVTDRSERLHIISTLTGRTVTSSKDLLKSEASSIIERLTSATEASNPTRALQFHLNGTVTPEPMDPEEA